MVDIAPIKAAAAEHRWEDVLAGVAGAVPTTGDEASELGALRSRALRFLARGTDAEAAARDAVQVAASESVRLAALVQLSYCAPAELARTVALADELSDTATGATMRVELARARMAAGDAPGAAELLDEAAELHPDIASEGIYFLARARLAPRLGLDDERSWLERALACTSPLDRARARCALGVWHSGRGQLEVAIAHVRAGLDEIRALGGGTHTEAQLLATLGDCLRVTGDLDGAEDCYRRALALSEARRSPDAAIQKVNLALVRLERSDPEGARQILEAQEEEATGTAVVHVAVGLGLGACAVELRDHALFERAYAPWFDGLPDGTALDPDFVTLAVRTARGAQRAGWRSEAVVAQRVALELARRLGHADVATQERRLRRLLDDGAPAALGPFFLLRPLAAGGFGEVWLARDRGGTEVAIKVLARRSEQAEEQLGNELRHVAALDHPGIVRLLNHGWVDRAAAVMQPTLLEGTRWLAVGLARGGTLQPWLGRLSFSEARQVLVSLLDALAHAHARGVLHLDIKPSNVLLADAHPGAGVLLADFGLASRPGPEGYTPSGTPQYMAPEQFGRDGQALGPWTDLYEVGCLGVALVSGASPFETSGTTVEALRAAHRSDQPELTPRVEVPRGFLAWLLRLLAKDPRDRFRHAADAARSLLSLQWVGEGAAARAGQPIASFSTIVLPASDDLGPVPAVPPEGAIDVPPPTVPLQWRRAERFVSAPRGDAEMALFGLRRTVLVGRDRERSLLWATLSACHRESRARAVVLEGRQGIGRSALGAWLIERAGELGAASTSVDGSRARIVWLPEHADADAVRQAEGLLGEALPTLVVASGQPGLDHPLSRYDETLVLPVGPLSDSEIREVVATQLAVAPALADALVERARGVPGYVRHALADLVQRRRLVPGEAGWSLRHGVALPDDLEALGRLRLGTLLTGIPPSLRRSLAVVGSLGPRVPEGAWKEACAGAGIPWDPRVRARLLDAGFAELHDDLLVLQPWIHQVIAEVWPPAPGVTR